MSAFLLDTNVLSEFNGEPNPKRGLILVTRNLKDFAGLGITLHDPWQSDREPHAAQ